MTVDMDLDGIAANDLRKQRVENRRQAGEMDATSRGTPLLPDDPAYMEGWNATAAAIESTPAPSEREIKWGQGDTRSGI